MRSKKSLALFLLCSTLIATTGCVRIYEDFTVNADGTVTQTAKTCISKEYMDNSGEKPSADTSVETLEDGKVYYTSTETQKTVTSNSTLPTDASPLGLILTNDIFYYPAMESMRELQLYTSEYSADDLYAKFNITLSSPIVDTNANITAGTVDKTASFDTSGTSDIWYAYTAEGKKQIEQDSVSPIIKGVKNNKYYSYYQMPNITVSDDIAVKEVILNGIQAVPDSSVTARQKTASGKIRSYVIYDWKGIVDGEQKSLIKEGKNVLTAYDLHGNSTSITYYVDTKEPVIKGVKNNKTYHQQAVLYIKDNQKLSKVTINNKKQKLTKKKLVKKGKYKGYYKIKVSKEGKHRITAYDQAGNAKSVKISINGSN